MNNLKFIDFCAGIGGGRLAFENLGLECLGFSEIDKNAEKTYKLFYGENEKNYGDLTKINTDELLDFDVMVGGFPCQTFSVIGQRKGMKDERGEIIFHLINIMKKKNVKFFLLENVKGLVNHDKGRSLKIILEALNEAGYHVDWKVLSSINYGVPQMRERIYFMGIRKDLLNDNIKFSFPKNTTQTANVEDFLIDDSDLTFNEKQQAYKTFLKYLNNKYNQNKHLIEKLLESEYLVLDTRQSDLRLYYNRVPTLRLGRHGILYVKNGKFRKLSGYESLLLQGFPKKLAKKAKENIAEAHILRQAGNAMTVNTVQAIAEKMLDFAKNLKIN
ncbi:MAG: DNA (cytosine-5-)-methyltransferase [Candidatus Moranbacteria bacterium]|nr:DNA (cytosine-5-)-methyltransferase [Candidatus Moranbacteria bacterium]